MNSLPPWKVIDGVLHYRGIDQERMTMHWYPCKTVKMPLEGPEKPVQEFK